MKRKTNHIFIFVITLIIAITNTIPLHAANSNIKNVVMMVRKVPGIGVVHLNGTYGGFCDMVYQDLKNELANSDYGYNLLTENYYLVNVNKGIGFPRETAVITPRKTNKIHDHSSGMEADIICAPSSHDYRSLEGYREGWSNNLEISAVYYETPLRLILRAEKAKELEIDLSNNTLSSKELQKIKLLAIDKKTTAKRVNKYQEHYPDAKTQIIKQESGSPNNVDLKKEAIKELKNSFDNALITDSILAINIWEEGDDDPNVHSLKELGYTVFPNQPEQSLEGFYKERYVFTVAKSELGENILEVLNSLIIDKKQDYKEELDGIESDGLERVRRHLCELNKGEFDYQTSSCKAFDKLPERDRNNKPGEGDGKEVVIIEPKELICQDSKFPYWYCKNIEPVVNIVEHLSEKFGTMLDNLQNGANPSRDVQ